MTHDTVAETLAAPDVYTGKGPRARPKTPPDFNQTLMRMLQEQRDTALNSVAELRAQLYVTQAHTAELEERNKELAVRVEHALKSIRAEL